MRTFIINRKRWRCGCTAVDPRNRHGTGSTLLQNAIGFQCCLGQISEQLGVEAAALVGKRTPSSLICVSREESEIGKLLVPMLMSSTGSHSQFSLDAMSINDSANTSRQQKEQLLIEAALRHDITLTFVGDYTDKPEFHVEETETNLAT